MLVDDQSRTLCGGGDDGIHRDLGGELLQFAAG
jgi:hypothetical protein